MSTAVTPVSGSKASPVLPINRLLSLLGSLSDNKSASIRGRALKLIGSLYFIFILYKYRRSVYGVRPRPEIPGPPGLPLV
ncbi:hypothetical protein BX616_007734, partial [Lobosporangium transversale]